MDAPLGRAVGNALEVIECDRDAERRGPDDLEELSVLLAARMLVARRCGGRSTRTREGQIRAARSIPALASRSSGDHRAPGRRSARGRRLRAAAVGADSARRRRHASGFVTALEAELIGRAAVALGAGRDRLDDAIDHGVGITVAAPPGSEVRVGDPVLVIRIVAVAALDTARALLEESVRVRTRRSPARARRRVSTR